MRMRALPILLVLGTSAWAGKSETPPVGPPWVRDLARARAQALEKGLPLFMYFTKTY